MYTKSVILGGVVVMVEAAIILAFTSGTKSGQASFMGISRASFSDTTLILIVVFLVTLVSILISFKIIKDAEIHKSGSKLRKLSNEYVQKSLELKKPKKQIIRELEKEGYKRGEIDSFLNDWESEEESIK